MKRKYLVFVLMLIIVFVSFSRSAFAMSYESDHDLQAYLTVEDRVVNKATDWFVQNYGEFYEIEDLHASLVRSFNNQLKTRYTVAIHCMTRLKAESPAELPFVRGLYDAVKDKRDDTRPLKAAVDYYAVEIVDFSKDLSPLSVDIVIPVDNETKDVNTAEIYIQDGNTTMLYPAVDYELDAQKLYLSGKNSVDEVYSAYQTAQSSARGFSDYNRIAARDYALAWVGSNVVGCYDHPLGCSILQDRTKWNNSVYYYNSNLVHDDCADFVSQAMSAGGLPEDGSSGSTWFRVKYTYTMAWGAPWTNVAYILPYMTSSAHQFWDSSSFAVCNAGNILVTASDHVVMITLNDTVTHRYTGHTNDKKGVEFYDVAGYQYYAIKTT